MNYLLNGEESERLRFRKLEPDDFHIWIDFFKDSQWSKYWIMKEQSPEEHCKTWIDKMLDRYANNQGGMNVLIDKRTDEFIGQCGLLIQTVDNKEELEVAYSIMPQHRGKGFAPEAARKCIDFAFDSRWSNSIISIIHEDNIESEKVALKNGLSLDKRTIFSNNPVNIYRIRHQEN